MHILAMVSTKNRYNVLPMTIQAVISQSRKPDEFIIFDDNDSPIDLRELPLYRYLFQLMDNYGIKWQVLFGAKKGQHHNHQKSQELATDLIWRLDDDTIPETDVLEKLEKRMVDGVGAVGGLVLEPKHDKIERPKRKGLNDTPDCQWYEWEGNPIEAEHLYSTFLYRKGLADYNLALSNVAHREETIFTHKIFLKGYKLIIDPSIITWHLREGSGGIRTYLNEEMWKHDENVFQMWLKHKDKKLVILDSGLGDHFAFLNILPKLKEKYGKVLIACCYPEVFEEEVISIDEGSKLENPELHNIYAWMDKHNWKQSIIKAYAKMYHLTL